MLQTEARLNRTKPLEELEGEKEILKRKTEEDRRIMNDKNSSTREKQAAAVRFSESTDELAGLEPQIQESSRGIYRLLHRKCDVRIFIHELQNFGKRTSERSERVSFSKFCNK